MGEIVQTDRKQVMDDTTVQIYFLVFQLLHQQIYYYLCITKKVISGICCRPLSWVQDKMAANHYVNHSSLYQMLRIKIQLD